MVALVKKDYDLLAAKQSTVVARIDDERYIQSDSFFFAVSMTMAHEIMQLAEVVGGRQSTLCLEQHGLNLPERRGPLRGKKHPSENGRPSRTKCQ